jgi:hypothetical protein
MRQYKGRSEFSKLDPTTMNLVLDKQQRAEKKVLDERKRAETTKVRVVQKRPLPAHNPTGSEVNFMAGLKAIDQNARQALHFRAGKESAAGYGR